MSDVEPWLRELRAGLERRVVASGARPDFLDVVTRAQQLDPERFDDDALDEAQRLSVEHGADDDDLGLDEDAPVRAVDGLDPWLDDVRAVVDRRVEQRSERPLPELSRPRASRRAAWWIGGAVAAAVLLAVGIGRLASTMIATEGSAAEEQAVHSSVPNDTEAEIDAVRDGRRAGHDEVASDARTRSSQSAATTAMIDAAADTDALLEDESTDAQAQDVSVSASVDTDEAAGDTDAAVRRARARDRKVDRLAQLTEQAQAQWRAGRRDEAIRLFTEVVGQGGRSRVAEMAYADLFTLAHQQHDAAAQRRWWSAYLRRFPRGRFADDARAGLCRGRSGDEAVTCWQDYLAREPSGSYRAEARAAVGEAPR